MVQNNLLASIVALSIDSFCAVLILTKNTTNNRHLFADKYHKCWRKDKIKTLIIVPTLAIFPASALLSGAVINAYAGHHNSMMFGADISEIDTNNNGVVNDGVQLPHHFLNSPLPVLITSGNLKEGIP